MYIDTHSHLNSNIYDDVLKVINNAKSEGVLKIVNCAEDIKTSEEVIKLSYSFKGTLYAAVGIHPLNVSKVSDNVLEELEEMLKINKVIGIGEIGLDYYYSKDDKEKQIYIFKEQLKLASKYNLPVIIHSREATQDTINILKEFNLRGIIHCFSGSVEVAREYIKMGYYLGVGGVLTFKNSKLKEVIKQISLENIVLETDAPFFTPEPYRKYKNESKYIPVIAKFLSEVKGENVEKVKKMTTKNANKIFDFSV